MYIYICKYVYIYIYIYNQIKNQRNQKKPEMLNMLDDLYMLTSAF